MAAPAKGFRLFANDFETVRSMATETIERLTGKITDSKTEDERAFYTRKVEQLQRLADRCEAALLADTSGDAEPDEDEDEDEDEDPD